MINKSAGPKTSSPAALPKWGNFLISGVAGSSKTSLLGLIGTGNKALIMDPEGGTVSYHSAWFGQQPDAAKLDDLHVVSFDDVTTAQDLVHRVVSTLDYIIKTKNSDGYTLVALDSLTEFQERFLSLHVAGDKRQSYGALRDSLYEIVHKARQAPVHTVFTARLKATFDEVQNRDVVRPEVSPGVWSVVSGLFDQIGFLEVKTQGVRTTRTLDFAHKTRTQGKDRFGIGAIDDPTFVKLQAVLDGDAKPAPKKPVPTKRQTPAQAAARR